MPINLPAIYPITDTKISGISLPEQVDRMISGGAAFIQIREKHGTSRDFYCAAVEAIKLARTKNVRVIINDRVDIAMMVDADGVHLGQEDISPVHARRLLGENKIIGYSTHTAVQAAEAVKLPIDYLAFGPVFPTRTKENPDPVVGIKQLAQIKQIAGGLPLVAIGGIDASNVRSVLDAGADTAAVISAALSGPDGIEDNVRKLLSM